MNNLFVELTIGIALAFFSVSVLLSGKSMNETTSDSKFSEQVHKSRSFIKPDKENLIKNWKKFKKFFAHLLLVFLFCVCYYYYFPLQSHERLHSWSTSTTMTIYIHQQHWTTHKYRQPPAYSPCNQPAIGQWAATNGAANEALPWPLRPNADGVQFTRNYWFLYEKHRAFITVLLPSFIFCFAFIM